MLLLRPHLFQTTAIACWRRHRYCGGTTSPEICDFSDGGRLYTFSNTYLGIARKLTAGRAGGTDRYQSFKEPRARIFKCLWGPGIDSKE